MKIVFHSVKHRLNKFGSIKDIVESDFGLRQKSFLKEKPVIQCFQGKRKKCESLSSMKLCTSFT